MQFAYRTGVVLSSRWRLLVNPCHKVLLLLSASQLSQSLSYLDSYQRRADRTWAIVSAVLIGVRYLSVTC
jgi:hypothetical protein